MIYHFYRDKNGKLIDDVVLPRSIDNRQIFPPILDQGTKPFCAAYSLSQICELIIWKEYGLLVAIDEDSLYAQAKKIDGMPDEDGTSLQAAIQSALMLGNFEGKVQVEPIAGNKDAVKRALHKYDFIYCGFTITDHWFSAKDSIPTGGKPIGGHAVCLAGYSDDGAIVANSWGTSWGCNGFSEIKWKDLEQQWMCGFGIRTSK